MRELSFRRRTESMDAVLQRHGNVGQHGSALVYVFVGIALFGVLMFIFSRGGSQNSLSLTDQQTKIVASEMLGYTRTIETAVNKLQARGCSENELSFENNSESGYTNVSSPTDKSCHIFNAGGGKIKYIYPPIGAETKYAAGPEPGYNNYAFNGNMQILDQGTTNTELILWTMTNKEVCDQINVSIGRITADDTFGNSIISEQFTGDFATAGPGVIGDEAYTPALSKGCFNRPTYVGQYIFYHVLTLR